MFYPFYVALSCLLFWTSMLSSKNAAESFQGQDKSGDYCIFSPFFVFERNQKEKKYMKDVCKYEEMTVKSKHVTLNFINRLDDRLSLSLSETIDLVWPQVSIQHVTYDEFVMILNRIYAKQTFERKFTLAMNHKFCC